MTFYGRIGKMYIFIVVYCINNQWLVFLMLVIKPQGH